ncbi:hypothetical protein Golax_004251 [Gossypium laxum]|uniref:RNase H type-1 domain-containing protein n=1 Tax=Gossypium laxum TaxID=34288 RepID=A0A7J9AHX3_9ROSI|nr:hypothetical protein [Gossypium laxum]
MVTLEANWNIDFLRIWVLETITRLIVSIPPPHPVDGLNRISWAPNFKGNFSVKSAYWSLKEDHWNPKDPMWKSPWNFKDGLTLLEDRDFNKISIHTNSLEVVHALQRSVSANSNSALVRRIQQRLRNFEHWVVRHVPREANIITDRIAKMVVVDMEGVNVLAITLTDF